MTTENKTADAGSETIITNDGADLQSEIEKLRAKNKELLAEKQKAKIKAQEAQDAADEAQTQAAERSGDIEALKALHTKELQKLQAKLEAADGDLKTIRVDNELTRAYNETGRPELAEQFIAWAKSRVQYENGNATADGVPLGEFVGNYLGSEIGGHFRRVADNSGSGATGSDGSKAFPMNASNWDNTKFMEYASQDPASARAMALAAGKRTLANSIDG
ncbi:hypothetical protein KRZ98_18250 [Sphingobium sp. AS12]|uniref:hypothetical protein n=1 Tax=Sphingobium sp. AS12 TaxID=2849495 RepID=UPI001C314AA5|nr:hypothetical protein [Sphingobium sp. AS12]MBV2150180.1 hypothetical protein [Sphingobium sp. AS12]